MFELSGGSHRRDESTAANSYRYSKRWARRRWARLHRELERAAFIALMQETVARAWDVPLAELRSSGRGCAEVAFARHVAMYLSHVTFGLSLATVGRHFGRDRTTAAYACRRIEDERDDREFDLLLDRLGQVANALTESLRGEEGRS